MPIHTPQHFILQCDFIQVSKVRRRKVGSLVEKRGCHPLGAWSPPSISQRWLMAGQPLHMTHSRDSRFPTILQTRSQSYAIYFSLIVDNFLQSLGALPIPSSQCGHVADSCHRDRNRHEAHNCHITCFKGNLLWACSLFCP